MNYESLERKYYSSTFTTWSLMLCQHASPQRSQGVTVLPDHSILHISCKTADKHTNYCQRQEHFLCCETDTWHWTIQLISQRGAVVK